MDSSVSPKDEIWFLRVCHHISNAVYQCSFAFTLNFKQFQKLVQLHLFPLNTVTLCFLRNRSSGQYIWVNPQLIFWTSTEPIFEVGETTNLLRQSLNEVLRRLTLRAACVQELLQSILTKED